MEKHIILEHKNSNVIKDLANKPKVFIGCSSSTEINHKYLLLAKSISTSLAELGYSLVFGAASFGMMGECYKAFVNQEKDIYSHTVAKYIKDLSCLPSKKAEVHENTLMRTNALYQDADIILFLPGGTGTISEIFGILEENRTTTSPKKVILFNYDGYYDKLLEVISFCVEQGFNNSSIYQYFTIINNHQEVIEEITKQSTKKLL